MKRVGIVTHYYRSRNYGGNLQAYALCKVIKNLGCEAEQICYPVSGNGKNELCPISVRNRINSQIFKILTSIQKKIYRKENKYYIDSMNKRKESFNEYNSVIIPNSKTVFDDSNFFDCFDRYDIFITGSDQVWNLRMYRPEFFLSTVPSDKIKASYAASMANTNLSSQQKAFIKEKLKDFNYISVREEKAKNVIEELVDKKVSLSLDPTLLLTKEDWDENCSERLVNEEYVFCYLLGNNPYSRKAAYKIAKVKNLKLVCIPMYSNGVMFKDNKKFDYCFSSASPADFVSLIKNSQYVITDSFHACVFSNIYKKKYLAFDRDKKHSMSSRIETLVRIFDANDRYVIKDKNIGELIKIIDAPIYDSDYFRKLLNRSKEYLISILSE